MLWVVIYVINTGILKNPDQNWDTKVHANTLTDTDGTQIYCHEDQTLNISCHDFD